jgi:hypothetical protein
VRLRRQFAVHDAALVTDVALDQLQSEMVKTVRTCNLGRKNAFERVGRAAGAVTRVQEDLLHVDQLIAMIRREIDKLKLEREIGIMNEATRQHGTITVNVNNSANRSVEPEFSRSGRDRNGQCSAQCRE